MLREPQITRTAEECERQVAERTAPPLDLADLNDVFEDHVPAFKITYAKCLMCGETWPCHAFRMATMLNRHWFRVTAVT